MGLSDEELGDILGLHAWTVEDVMRTPDCIESWPIDWVLKLAEALDMDAGELIGNRRFP